MLDEGISTMPELDEVASTVGEALRMMNLRSMYPHEERDLQPHVQAEVDRCLSAKFGQGNLVTTISVGGKDRPNLKLRGTSFWVDIDVKQAGDPLVAIEVKRIHPRKRASGEIAQAIGQALIYSCLYPKVFVFIVHSGIFDPKCSEYDEALEQRLTPLNIEVIIRRPNAEP